MVHGLYFEEGKNWKTRVFEIIFGENIKSSEIINPIRGICSLYF